MSSTQCAWCIGALTTAPLWGIALVLAYWWWGDYAVWNPVGGPATSTESVEPVTERVRVGDVAQIRWSYTVHRDCERRISVYAAGEGYLDPLVQFGGSTRGEGTGTHDRVSAHVMRFPGRYRIYSIAESRCNPLRTYVERSPEAVIHVSG